MNKELIVRYRRAYCIERSWRQRFFLALACAVWVCISGCLDLEKKVSSTWSKALFTLAFDLDTYGRSHNSALPYDSRGSEYALYDLMISTSNDALGQEPLFENGYEPFRLDHDKKCAVALKIDYLNPKPGEVLLKLPYQQDEEVETSLPIVVLLVLKYEDIPPTRLLLVASDVAVYHVDFSTGPKPAPEASDYLGVSLLSLTEKYPVTWVYGFRPPAPYLTISNRGQIRVRSASDDKKEP